MAPGQVHGRPTLLSIRCGGGTQPAVGGNILFEANSNRHLMLTRGGTIDPDPCGSPEMIFCLLRRHRNMSSFRVFILISAIG
jgi:hypothetical protein